jgi:steroid 5-alpha reductase family enzyme
VTLASLAAALLFVAVAMSATMQLATRIERRTGNSGWIDVVWTFGLGATGAMGALLPFGEGPFGRRLFVAALVAAWALRLGLHIAGRTKGISDDPRYARMKRDWGPRAPAKMAQLLQLQALASIPLAIGIILAAHNPAAFGQAQDALGLAVFLAGIIGGAIADRQLRGFAQSGLGGICDTGLWAFSRHPNYFFEAVLWTAYAVIASAAAYPFGWLAWLAPAAITLLLVRVSGIPPLEQHMLAKHGAAYRDYQRRTSAFIPLPPKGATP